MGSGRQRGTGEIKGICQTIASEPQRQIWSQQEPHPRPLLQRPTPTSPIRRPPRRDALYSREFTHPASGIRREGQTQESAFGSGCDTYLKEGGGRM